MSREVNVKDLLKNKKVKKREEKVQLSKRCQESQSKGIRIRKTPAQGKVFYRALPRLRGMPLRNSSHPKPVFSAVFYFYPSGNIPSDPFYT